MKDIKQLAIEHARWNAKLIYNILRIIGKKSITLLELQAILELNGTELFIHGAKHQQELKKK